MLNWSSCWEAKRGPAVRAWLEAGPNRQLALPWCMDRAASSMIYRTWRLGAPLMPDAAGIPSAEGEAVVPDILLIPCLGWSDANRRLGYGGGYFDRYISGLEGRARPVLVGAAFYACRVDDALFDELDLPLDFIVTERGRKNEKDPLGGIEPQAGLLGKHRRGLTASDAS